MSTIRSVALMHQYAPGSHPSHPSRSSRPPSRALRAVAVGFPVLLTVGALLAAVG